MDCILISPREVSMSNKKTFREELITRSEEFISRNPVNFLYVKQFRENLGIAAIAAYLKKFGYTSIVIDASALDMSVNAIVDLVMNENPKVVGISLLYDLYAVNSCRIVLELRKAGYKGHITFGGPFITHAYKFFLVALPGLNSVLRGEGECSWLELMQCIKDGNDWRMVKGIAYIHGNEVVVNGEANIVENLSELPFPTRDSLGIMKKKGIQINSASIYSSRGCQGQCTYCTAPANAKLVKNSKWRGKDAISIVNEIEYLVKEFNVSYIYFVDENFCGYGIGFKERLYNIAEEIKKRNLKIKFHAEIRVDTRIDENLLVMLKEAGLKDVLLGLESGSDKALRRWHKGTTVDRNYETVNLMTKLGFDVEPAMIMVDPYTTVDEFADTVEFIKKAKLYMTKNPLNIFNQLIVFPGTRIEEELAQAHVIEIPDEWDVKEDLNNLEQLKIFCKRVSSREYEVIDAKIRELWSILIEYVRQLSELYDVIIPNIIAVKRTNYLQQIDNRKNTQREFLEYLSQIRKWKSNIGYLIMDLLEISVKWGVGPETFNLSNALNSIIWMYDQKWLHMDIDSFLGINLGDKK